MDRFSQDRSSQNRSTQGRSSQESSSQEWSSYDRSSQGGSSQGRSGQDIQDRSSQDRHFFRPKMHLRMEFDSGVGPTCCLYFIILVALDVLCFSWLSIDQSFPLMRDFFIFLLLAS